MPRTHTARITNHLIVLIVLSIAMIVLMAIGGFRLGMFLLPGVAVSALLLYFSYGKKKADRADNYLQQIERIGTDDGTDNNQ